LSNSELIVSFRLTMIILVL